MASQNRPQSFYEGSFRLSSGSQVQPQPHHRHQASLEDIINCSQLGRLTTDERSRARGALNDIIDHVANHVGSKGGYSRHLLVRHTYEYSRSEMSKDTFLRVFFNIMGLDISSSEDINTDDSQIRQKFIDFADMLLEQFFVPLKANGKITPQPSPAQLSAMQSVRSPHEISGTLDRVSYLRALCLARDKHRCVISRVFDSQEEIKRTNQHGADARDDEGNLLSNEVTLAVLQVAHILPHSLTKMSENLQLNDAIRTTIGILNMFDCDVAHLIEGSQIDSPRNAISLTPTFHGLFGDFRVYFDAIAGEEHTYRIGSFLHPVSAARRGLPITRKLFLSEGRVIDAPSPRLLALHRAIAYILHLSGAGEYIDKLLQDFEEMGVQADGSTDLARIVNLRLGGWLDRAVQVN
ncbi:hypothetical protein I7I51_06741 [Histoplasma capsulatum]|uniref:HNH nuclease domain-containing protein n=1 Tax=Ajellomyces capsulatus TaxID=5037 RepID=A0A8A1ML69_AJECA|nr:hypothetical protein I7I51_06741 [Histoplasma capsulatum]